MVPDWILRLFQYPVTRRFERRRWLLPTFLFISFVWFALVTVISIMVVGYETKEIPDRNYNTTIPSWTWRLPRLPEMKTCRPSNIKINERSETPTIWFNCSTYHDGGDGLPASWLSGSRHRSACRWIGLSKQPIAKLFGTETRDCPVEQSELQL
jgi:hypothetical protein